MSPLATQSIFASYSVCATVAWATSRWAKFVDEVGFTVFHKNNFWVFAASRAIAKADAAVDFTLLHCRISTIQPARVGSTTSECWYTRCWHFCSCSSHKTIPSLRELVVTQLGNVRCFVTYLPIGITQVFVMIARIGYKVKLWQLQKD